MANPHILIAGLGNYTHPMTRHSLGLVMTDVLTSRLGLSLTATRAGFTANTTTQVGQDTVELTFFKPRALMNISGRPVVQMLRSTAVNPAKMIVLHDSLNHKPRTISPKFGGSANGHNGVRSVITALGNNHDFYRLRLGIGRSEDISQYVLGPLSAEELDYWSVTGPGSELVWKALAQMIQHIITTR